MAATALPAGPRMPAALQGLGLLTRPLPFLRRCRREHGDVFTVRTPTYGRLVVITDAALVREIFSGRPETFHTGEVRRLLAPVLGRHSLLLLDEDAHLRERRLMLPPFHGEALPRYRALIEEITSANLDTWPTGRPFAVHPHMQALTLEVILRVVIGAREPERLDALRDALRDVLALQPTLLLLASSMPREPRWLPQWRRFLRLRAHTHDLLEAEIRRRRAEPAGDDVLSLLVSARTEDGDALSDEELRDELVTLLLAGHETTATALAWALERLVRHPTALERTREDDAYLDAVIRETLRVRPVINEVGRDLTRDTDIDGHRLPAGTRLLASLLLIQRDETNFPDADAFRPERFLDGGADTPYTWIPFGGGVRRCLGASFAMLEMTVVLRAVLERYEVRSARPDAERPRMRHVTFMPERGGEIVATPR